MIAWSALVLGMAGSLHCVGMCGPIALALPKVSKRGYDPLIGRILYNLGRVLTYSILGFAVGTLGQGLAMAGIQQIISFTCGALILIGILINLKWESKFLSIPVIDRLLFKLKQRMGAYLRRAKWQSLFHIGILNGLLPCGFVYIALAGALATGNALSSAGFMALFGLGTFPAMLLISMMGTFLSPSRKKAFKPVLTVFAICFAFLLILRGLNLGIPYISPQLSADIQTVSTQQCH